MRRVTRWHSGVIASIALVAAGFLLGTAGLVLAAIVPLTFLGYAALSSVPDPSGSVALERTCTPARPLPGERVEVTLEVRNETDRTLPDVRVVDGVPPALEVVEGDAATAVTLRPGERATLSYTLRPQRGSYAFDPAWIRLRSLSATAVATGTIDPAGDADLECRVPVEGVPTHRRTIPFVGAVATDSGGPGYEFHSTRDYRQGDPPNRIDWRRYARTGELGTVRYREQEAASVVVIVDGRDVARVAPEPGHPDGITLAAYAGVVTTSALAAVGHRVGVVGLGVRGRTPGVYEGPPAYVDPGAGADVRGRIARVCDAVAARGRDDPADRAGDPGRVGAPSNGAAGDDRVRARADGGDLADHLDALFPPDVQLVVCTPAVDDAIVDLSLALRRRGYPLSAVSPDVTDREDVGARLAAIRREARLERLRRADVPAVDWNPRSKLASALEHGFGEVIR